MREPEARLRELEIDPKKVSDILIKFIAGELARAGFERIVLGLSGGIDSATTAYLSSEAVGPENVWAILMSSRVSPPESVRDAEEVIETLGINSKVIAIDPMMAPYEELFPDMDRIRRGNVMARQRMVILYDQSKELAALVCGASNKTELLLGYGTIYGDLACAFNPLGGLYKTQVRELAEYLGVPKRIREKVPSAELWEGQTDEGELGLRYEVVDRLLYYMVDKGRDEARLVELGFEEGFIRKVSDRVKGSEFKRRLPAIAKIPKGV